MGDGSFVVMGEDEGHRFRERSLVLTCSVLT